MKRHLRDVAVRVRLAHTSDAMKSLRTAACLSLMAGAALSAAGIAGLPRERTIAVLRLEGVVDPVMARYVERGYREAEQMGAECVVLSINTPGGLMTSMREIVGATLNSPVPTIGYVTPGGALAGSAGAFIMMACHLVAMSPGTTIGAAHPVGGKGEDIGKHLDAKVTNDAAAFMRSLAEARGRDAKWAEKAVTKSLSLNEHEALKQRIVEAVAERLERMIETFDGRTISWTNTAPGGKAERRTLRLKGARVVEIAMGWREKFFHMLAHPELAYILLSLGTLGLVFELQNPSGFTGVPGAICLILALISLSILPFNVGGLMLMALGVGLFIADLKFSTHGGLSFAGVICLLLGSLTLFSPMEPFIRVSRPLIYSMVGMMSAFFGTLVYLGLRAQRAPAAVGGPIAAGTAGHAVTSLDPDGTVHVRGEEWTARSVGGRVRKGGGIIVTSVKGLTLEVRGTEPDTDPDRPPNKRRR